MNIKFLERSSFCYEAFAHSLVSFDKSFSSLSASRLQLFQRKNVELFLQQLIYVICSYLTVRSILEHYMLCKWLTIPGHVQSDH